MASNVERRWRQLVEGASKTGPTTNGHNSNNVQAAAAKKRKLSEPVQNAKAPLAKKVAVGSSKPTAASTAPSTTKSTSAPPVKDAKSDSSFFSAPKPKPKLPTFKKAPPPPVKKEPSAGQLDIGIAQPSSIDPFQEVLKSMGKTRTQSPVTTVTPPTSTPTPTATTGLTKSGKKKKSVTWAPDGKLESIRLIERAVYDDDPAGDGVHHHHNSLRDLDRGEGAALHAHLFEETLDWSEPILIEIPTDIERVSRGEASQEKIVQEQREQTALVAIYLSDAHIPESPGEPTHIVDADEMGKDVVMMTCGTEVDEEFFSGEQHQQQPPSNFATVADLVAQLATGNSAMGMSGMDSSVGTGDSAGMANTNGHGDPMAAFQQLQSLSQEQIQMLLQQFNPAALGLGGGDSLAGGGPGPGNYSEYGYHDDGGGSDRPWADTNSGVGGRGGRGGGRFRGRGRGGGSEGGFRHNKRKPCSFFQSGRCKYGDQCDYAHELIS
ncbi:hypothetical protein L218DRAFT_609705 [Marasmius fiardii PR-910]|nr:hypothetical protein L218DRAFT_609705 [Marasmius fiardii PR-910]